MLKKQSFLTLVALAVAAVGVVIALAAYFKNRNSYLYDEDDDFLFDDPDDLEYYTSDSDAEDSQSVPQTPDAKPEDGDLKF